MHTLAGLSSRVAAVGAGRLLDVERPLAYRVENIRQSHVPIVFRDRSPSTSISSFHPYRPNLQMSAGD